MTTASPRYRPLTPDLGYYTSPAASPANSPRLPSPRMARTVQFAAPEGARDARADEREVMRTFNKHVRSCDTCYPVMTAEYPSAPLCSKGHGYVVDMKPYFFCKRGKPYSQIDKQYKQEVTRVFVPSDYRHVATLFEALNSGYSTEPSPRSKRPRVVVHQAPAVQVPEPRRRERPTIIVPVQNYTTASRSPRGERYHEERRPREPRYRGSLYYEDERRRHRQDPEIIRNPERYYQ